MWRDTEHVRLSSDQASRPHSCPVFGCDRRFKRRFALKEHIKTHTGEKPFACPVHACGKRFSTSGNLSRHKLLHPWLNEPLECLVLGCGCRFASEAKLQRHLDLVHLGASAHRCTFAYCGSAFSSAGNLRRHMKIHNRATEAISCETKGYEIKSVATWSCLGAGAEDIGDVEAHLHLLPDEVERKWTILDTELLSVLACLFDYE